MITNKKKGFILIESLNALLLCAFALLLLFALMRFSSHRFALQYAQTSSLADILTLDSLPCAPQTLKIDNKTYESLLVFLITPPHLCLTRFNISKPKRSENERISRKCEYRAFM